MQPPSSTIWRALENEGPDSLIIRASLSPRIGLVLNAILEVKELECMRGDRRVFNGLGFEAAAGSLLRIEGPNGSGKTSLLRMLCGLLQPHAGQILWQGSPIARLAESYRAQIAYLGHHNALKEDLTALENLRFATALQGVPVQTDALSEALKRFGIVRNARLPVRVLSQGQKRRVTLAALSLRTDRCVWLLDEPFVALDKEAVAEVAQLIEAQLRRGSLVFYTTHQDVPIATDMHSSIRLA